MTMLRHILLSIMTLTPFALEAQEPPAGGLCATWPCPNVSPTVVADPPVAQDIDHQVLFFAVADTMSKYFRAGGTLRFTFALSRRYALGFQTGVLANPPEIEVPIDLVNAWEFGLKTPKVSVPFNLITGVSLAWDAHTLGEIVPIWNLLAESGVKMEINDIIGVAVLAHFGVGLIYFVTPRVVAGGRVGPIFYF